MDILNTIISRPLKCVTAPSPHAPEIPKKKGLSSISVSQNCCGESLINFLCSIEDPSIESWNKMVSRSAAFLNSGDQGRKLGCRHVSRRDINKLKNQRTSEELFSVHQDSYARSFESCDSLPPVPKLRKTLNGPCTGGGPRNCHTTTSSRTVPSIRSCLTSSSSGRPRFSDPSQSVSKAPVPQMTSPPPLPSTDLRQTESSVSPFQSSSSVSAASSAPRPASSGPMHRLARSFIPSRPSQSSDSAALHLPGLSNRRPSVHFRGGNTTARKPLLSRQSVPSLSGRNIQWRSSSGSNKSNAVLVTSESKFDDAQALPRGKRSSVAAAQGGGCHQLSKCRRTVGGVPQPSIGLRQPFNSTMKIPVALRGRGSVIGGSRGLSMAAQRIDPQQVASLTPHHREGYDPYGLDEYDEEDLNFIDDGPIEGQQTRTSAHHWKSALRGITGYNPSLYGGQYEGEACESSWTQQEQEEARSAKIAAVEDATELKRIQAEERQKRLREK